MRCDTGGQWYGRGEQVPRLNAALLSMVHGVEDATNSVGMAESGVLEAMETPSQVGVSQATLSPTILRMRIIAGLILNWPAGGWGLSVVFEWPLACGRSGCLVNCVRGTRSGHQRESQNYPTAVGLRRCLRPYEWRVG